MSSPLLRSLQWERWTGGSRTARTRKPLSQTRCGGEGGPGRTFLQKGLLDFPISLPPFPLSLPYQRIL